MRAKHAAVALFFIAALSAFLLARYGWLGLCAGVVLGWTGHLMWSWGWLEFLEEPSPWRALRWELANFRNVFVGNRRSSWEQIYQDGGYELLVATAPEPRHYLIAGIVRTRFPDGARLLDIGCGCGMLYPLVAGAGFSYFGIDVIDTIIQECRQRFSGDDRCAFETCAFEDFNPEGKFDVIVMSELLYYLPAASIETLFRRAQSFLRDEHSIVAISMGAKSNLGIRRIWRRLDHLSSAIHTTSLIDSQTGSIRTLRVYPAQQMRAGRQ